MVNCRRAFALCPPEVFVFNYLFASKSYHLRCILPSIEISLIPWRRPYWVILFFALQFSSQTIVMEISFLMACYPKLNSSPFATMQQQSILSSTFELVPGGFSLYLLIYLFVAKSNRPCDGLNIGLVPPASYRGRCTWSVLDVWVVIQIRRWRCIRSRYRLWGPWLISR